MLFDKKFFEKVVCHEVKPKKFPFNNKVPKNKRLKIS